MLKGLLLGLAAIAATGCATGTRTTMTEGTFGGYASPPTMGDDFAYRCELDGGWYDRAAHACDSVGD